MKKSICFRILMMVTLVIIMGAIFKYNVYAQEIAAFDFDANGCVSGQKLESYGDKNGYGSTSGSASLYCFMGTDAVRALEWSDQEYSDGGYSITPIVRASDKNQWGDTPAFVIECSTKNLYNIRFSAALGGSSNGPAHFKLQYSTVGSTYKDILGTDISISFDTRKVVKNYYSDINIPEEAWDKPNVYIRVITRDTTTVAGGSYKSTPSGGEIAINHIKIAGDTERKVETTTIAQRPDQQQTTTVSESRPQNNNQTTTAPVNNGEKNTTAGGKSSETTKNQVNRENINQPGGETNGNGENIPTTEGNGGSSPETVTKVVVNSDGSTETVIVENNTETSESETTSIDDDSSETTDKKDNSKKQKVKKSTDTMTTSQVDKKEKNSSNNMVIVIILAVILIIGVTTAALINLKRKE